jgi:RNA-binding protein 39
MTDAMDVDALLEEAARDVEKTRELQAIEEARDSPSRKDDRNGDRRDRHSDRRDRSRDRRGDRRRSRDRDHRRRDDSRPRSSRGDEDRYPRSTSRDRYRGARRDRAGGDYYSGGGRARSRSPRGDRPQARRERERSAVDRRGSDVRKAGRRDKTSTPEVTEDDRDFSACRDTPPPRLLRGHRTRRGSPNRQGPRHRPLKGVRWQSRGVFKAAILTSAQRWLC